MNINDQFAEHLNNIIRDSGQIQKNDRRIWQILNDQTFTNEDWLEFMKVMLTRDDEYPNSLSSRAYEHIEAAGRILNEQPLGDRTLDRKTRHSIDPQTGMRNQAISWAIIQANREQYNRIHGIDLPNADSSRVVKTQEKPQAGTKEYRRWRVETNITIQQNIFEIID